MKKQIEITLIQQDELLNVGMNSFREANLAQCIRDTNKWWINNFLPNMVIQRVDRISPLVYEIIYSYDWESPEFNQGKSIFESSLNDDEM